eukprot:scaffold549370_cov14-Prasinocladus_malaysianus.AAC.1
MPEHQTTSIREMIQKPGWYGAGRGRYRQSLILSSIARGTAHRYPVVATSTQVLPVTCSIPGTYEYPARSRIEGDE